MTAASHRTTRSLLVLLTGLWAWVMVHSGFWVATELPHVLGVSSRWFGTGGVALIAAGVFIFLLAAGRCFPLASPKVRLGFEILPWIGLGVAVIGGLV